MDCMLGDIVGQYGLLNKKIGMLFSLQVVSKPKYYKVTSRSSSPSLICYAFNTG